MEKLTLIYSWNIHYYKRTVNSLENALAKLDSPVVNICIAYLPPPFQEDYWKEQRTVEDFTNKFYFHMTPSQE